MNTANENAEQITEVMNNYRIDHNLQNRAQSREIGRIFE